MLHHTAMRDYGMIIASTLCLALAGCLPVIHWSDSADSTRTDAAAEGFSNIHNADSWSPDELRQQGIIVKPWKHGTQTNEPPVDWARVAFDTSHVSNYQSVLMTAWFRTGRGDLQSASRVQTTKDEPRVLQLLIAIGQTDRNRSSLEIVIWQETASGAKEAYGYKLSAERIGELVRQASNSASQ